MRGENMRKGELKVTEKYFIEFKNAELEIVKGIEEIPEIRKFLLSFNELDELDHKTTEEIKNKLKEKGIDVNITLEGENVLSIPRTNYPNNVVIPKDKVTNSLFDGKLAEGVLNPIATEGRGSKKELTAIVTIDFNELKDVEVISRPLTAYDREVHDAIVSLYVDGGNEYITPLMIYRTMTGNPKAKLTPKQERAISESVTKCSMSRIRIDAKDEAKAFKMDKLIYEGNLIYTKKITGTHKGLTSEWIHILERPVLYDYANSKGQIARAEIGLLNTPVSKNEETIILQGYLLKRILTMKNNQKISKNIVCETIYKQLDIQDLTGVSLRNKQKKIRNSVKEIFNDWIEKKFIKGYKENKGANNAIVSFTIQID